MTGHFYVDQDWESMPYNTAIIYDGTGGETERLRQFFCYIIWQAIFDLCQENAGVRWDGIRRDAKQWLLYNNKEFPHYCDLAGVDAHIIRSVIRKAVQCPEAMLELSKNVSRYIVSDKVKERMALNAQKRSPGAKKRHGGYP